MQVDLYNLLLPKARMLFEDENYEKCCAYYNLFFGKLLERTEDSIYDYAKDIFTYANAFNKYLTSKNSASKFDVAEIDDLKEYIEKIDKKFIEDSKDEDDDYELHGAYIKDTKETIEEIISEFFKDIREDHFKIQLVEKQERSYSTTRPEEYPHRYIYNDHLFIFANRRINACRYVCKYGSNRHKGMCKCKAAILIPFPLPENMGIEDLSITVLNDEHTCPQVHHIASKLISDAQIKSWVEEIYLSTSPRPTRTQIFSLLLKRVQDKTEVGQELQTVSESLVNNFYTALEKKYKVIDEDFRKMLSTKRGTIFERFKYRFGEGSLIICYCSDFQQRCISESHFIFIDGTFDTAPTNFKQVLVIMGQTAHMNVPLAYLLLPNKMQSTYVIALTLFKNEVQASFWSGATFITDFEKAEFNAVKQVLMNTSHHLQLCYFHFVQSMMRHFNDYPEDELTDHLFDLSKMLPFIPQKVLYDAFEVMETYPEIKKFVNYFKENYLKIYEFDDWSVFGKPSQIVISNNVAESHNALLKREIGIDPSLQQFEVKIKEIEDDFQRKYSTRTNEEPDVRRYDETSFRRKLRELIDILRRRKSPSQRRNGFEDLFNNTEDQYFVHELNTNSEDDVMDHIDANTFDENANTDEENASEENANEEDTNGSKLHQEKINYQQKVNIRKIPESARRILDEKSREFNSLQARSLSRKTICDEAFNLVKEIVPNITEKQVRSFFSNNKK